MILVTRLDSAALTNGSLYEFDAMISCILGGISLAGGRGKIIQALFGAIFLMLFFNGNDHAQRQPLRAGTCSRASS